MRYDFEKKVVAVTGASGKSMGVTIARAFFEKGASVAICSRSKERIRESREMICQGKGEDRILAIEADLGEVDQCRKFIRETVKTFGRIDILINNAAVQFKESAQDTTQESWDMTLNVNTRGYFFCMQETASDMISRSESGVMINISSAHAQMALENRLAYAVSKAGVDQMTRSAAREWGPYGIRVNAVAVGSFPTGMSRRGLMENDVVSPRLPLRRRGRLEEIANTCLFLASEDASYITGALLNVDGGFSLAMS